MSQLESIIQYPVDFPIKVMGRNHAAFAQTIVALVREHAPDFDPTTVEMRSSREGKYISLTVTIRAVSREQLDGLYRALSDHPMVSVAL